MRPLTIKIALFAIALTTVFTACKKDGNPNNANNDFAPNIQPVTNGLQANTLYSMDINSDGRYVVYSTSVRLSAQDTDDFYDVYRFDRVANTTTLISTNLARNSFGVSITDDGNKILYSASEIATQGGGIDRPTAIYLWDNGNILTVQEGTQDQFFPYPFLTPQVAFTNIISPDGKFIAANVDINHFIYDIDAQQSTLISNGQPVDFSSDGRYHTWVDVDILSPGQSPQVWRYDRLTQENIPITNDTKYSDEPRCNGDGSLVVFISELSNLTGAEDNNGLADAFLFDASIPKYTRISPASANGPTTGVDISADGNVIAFATSDNTMGLTDNNLLSDVVLQINGQKTNITGNANGQSGLPRLSSDGNYVLFASEATNIGGGSVGPNIYLAGPLRQ